MSILLMLIPLGLLLVGVAAWAFAWAVRRGQFDDLDTPALDILRDDEDDEKTKADQVDGARHAD
jgi:cbb3-type cytochrome oxidase maturation protein